MGFPLSFLTGQFEPSNVQKISSGDVNVNISAVKQLSAQNGQTITGEIVKLEDGNVIMKVGDELVKARLGSEMDVSVGQTMTFQVQNQNGLIALRALFTNTDIHPTESKALAAAGLPINEQTVGLTNAMMKEGMNISPQNLQMMYRAVIDHPQASGDLLVRMSRLQIPINSDNITQFQNYENLNHELSGSISQMADSFMELTNALAKGDLQSPGGLFDTSQQILGTLTEDDLTFFKDALTPEEQKLAQALSQAWADGQTEGTPGDAGGDFLKQLSILKEQAQGEIIGLKDGQNSSTVGSGAATATDAMQAGQPAAGEGAAWAGGASTEMDAGQLLKMLTEEERTLAQNFHELGVADREIPKLLHATPSQMLTFLSELLKEASQMSPKEQTALARFLTSPSMEKLMQAQLKDVFALKPEEVAQKEQVGRLYESLLEKSARLTESLSGTIKADSAFLQNVNNLSQNIHFMQDLNQVMQYIQIPFQMHGKDANGELYVFTNKKSLASEDGSVSAFLHLDMDHLGPTSVYVQLKDANVSTRFYLSDDEILDFIGENIHLLDERLQKRGYHMNATMQVKKEEEPFDVIGALDEAQKGTGGIGRMLSSHGFDMRA